MSAAEASQKPSDGRSPESLANGRAKAASPSRPLGLPDICFSLRRRVKAFLDLQTEDELLRRTQSRARESVSLLREALQRYGWVNLSWGMLFSPSFAHFNLYPHRVLIL